MTFSYYNPGEDLVRSIRDYQLRLRATNHWLSRMDYDAQSGTLRLHVFPAGEFVYSILTRPNHYGYGW